MLFKNGDKSNAPFYAESDFTPARLPLVVNASTNHTRKFLMPISELRSNTTNEDEADAQNFRALGTRLVQLGLPTSGITSCVMRIVRHANTKRIMMQTKSSSVRDN